MENLKLLKMDNFVIGQYAEFKKSYSSKDVAAFSELSQDINPVHLDADFAASTIFKKPIVHGFLYGSMLSALIANELPGPGSVYMYQDMKFLAPVFHDEVLIAKVEITAIDKVKKTIDLHTTVRKEATNKEVIVGQAKIKFFG